MYDEFFTKAHELRRQGVPFATATVVRAEKPTSGKPGDKAIITHDGTMYGWIGGSCAQPTVVQAAVDAMADHQHRLIRLSPQPSTGGDAPEGFEEVAMTCFSGGTLDIFVESQQPTPQLLVIGHLPVAQALVQLGRAMSFRVIAVDRQGEGQTLAQADEILEDLDELANRVTPSTYAVVATHGTDDARALAAVLRTSAPYVGLVASRKRGSQLFETLRAEGLAAVALQRLKVPAGLDIGARRGDEIALSIMAEIVQERQSTTPQEVTAEQTSQHRVVRAEDVEEKTPPSALEPPNEDQTNSATAAEKACCHSSAKAAKAPSS